MTVSATAHSNLRDSAKAGEEIGARLLAAFDHQTPDVVIVFASSRHDYSGLLCAIERSCKPRIMVGCSSAGEFTNDSFHEGAASVVGLRSSEMKFNAILGRGLREDRANAARQVIDGLQGLKTHE